LDPVPYYLATYYASSYQHYGYRNCSSSTDCYDTARIDSAYWTNVTAMINCELDGYYDYTYRCRARQACDQTSGNVTCGEWQFCQMDDYGYGGYCTDFYQASCTHTDNCSNHQTGTKANLSIYECEWKDTNPHGICHYFGPICSSDSECKSPNQKCNASISYAGELYGWCYTTESQDNYCTEAKYRGVDKGALYFICLVIAISVAKDLREAIISEMKLRKLYKSNPEIAAITWRKLLCREPADAKYPLSGMWATTLTLGTLEAVLFIRKYMFIPLVVAVTCAVIVDKGANDIILNGVAIFFVVDIDNLFFDFFHDKGEKDEMEENGKLDMNPKEARYLKLISLISATMLTMSLILVLTDKAKILSFMNKCSDSDGIFRYGGLFVICLLFIGYFLAEISVPILELIIPTDKKKKTNLRESFKEISWQQIASTDGKLHIGSQSIALIFLLSQGALGALIFISIVVAYSYVYIGYKAAKWSNADHYADQATSMLADIRTGYEDTISYSSYYYY